MIIVEKSERIDERGGRFFGEATGPFANFG